MPKVIEVFNNNDELLTLVECDFNVDLEGVNINNAGNIEECDIKANDINEVDIKAEHIDANFKQYGYSIDLLSQEDNAKLMTRFALIKEYINDSYHVVGNENNDFYQYILYTEEAIKSLSECEFTNKVLIDIKKEFIDLLEKLNKKVKENNISLVFLSY